MGVGVHVKAGKPAAQQTGTCRNRQCATARQLRASPRCLLAFASPRSSSCCRQASTSCLAAGVKLSPLSAGNSGNQAKDKTPGRHVAGASAAVPPASSATMPPGTPWQCRPPSPVPSIRVSIFSTSCSGAALPLGEDRAVAGSTAGCGSSRDCRCRWPEGWRAGCRVLNGAWGRVLLSLPRREGAPDRRCAWQLGARALAVSCAAIGAGDENSSLKCTA